MPIKFNGINTSNLSINNVESDVQVKSAAVPISNYLPTGEKIDYTEVDFETLIAEIELSMKRVRELGIDIKEYENFLADVRKEGANISKSSGTQAQISYNPSVAKLQVLRENLDSYECYATIYNSILYLEKEIETDISKEKLSNCISQMIAYLVQLDKKNNFSFDKKKEIMDTIFKITYKIIKKEISITGESQLLLYVKNNMMYASQLNLIIARELSNVEFSPVLERNLYDIKQHGTDSNYVDLELIILIMYQSGEYNLTDSIMKELSSKISIMETRNRDAKDLLSKIKGEENSINSFKNNRMRDSKKSIRTQLISFLVGLAMFLPGANGITNFFKKVFEEPYYEQTKKIYSSATGKTTEEIDEVIGQGYGEDSAKVILYDEYDGEGNRKYVTFDVSDYDFETPEEYYQQGFEYDLFPDETGVDEDPSSYKDSYSEVVLTTYKHLGEKNDHPSVTKVVIVMSYITYIMLLILLDLIRSLIFMHSDIFGYYPLIMYISEGCLGDDISSIRDANREIKEKRNNINRKLSELYSKLVLNEQVKQQFDELYHKNLFLLKDEEELKRRFDRAVEELKTVYAEFDKNNSAKVYKREK